MSEASTTTTPEPLDNLERKRLLKEEAITLAGELAAHGAQVELGKVTHLKAVVEVRQLRRERQDITVTRHEEIIAYTIGQRRDAEIFDPAEVRRMVIAPQSRWQIWWQLAVVLVGWVLVAIGWRIYYGAQSKYILLGIVLAGAIATIGVMYLGRGLRQASRRRRTMERLRKRRKA